MLVKHSTGSGRPKVLITRPAAQATDFAQRCTQIGFDVTLMPCLEIVPASVTVDSLFNVLEAHESILFTSSNSVHIAHALCPLPWNEKSIHAIGAATAKALQSYQQAIEFTPAAPYNSEAYLARIRHKVPETLLILKGRGGRDLIHSSLSAQQCRVSHVDLYYRRLPDIAAEKVDDVITQDTPDIISVTSNEILSNLCSITTQHTELIRSIPLVVNSVRCAEFAKSKGFTLPARVALSAGDQGQVACLKDWLEENY